MAKQGSGTKRGAKKPTTAQKRRSRVVSAIGRWNGKRDKGSRLNRKEFWEVYREITGKYPNTTEAVKAVRLGKFALSGKSKKGKAGAKGAKAPKRPIRTWENGPTGLSGEFFWYDVDDQKEGVILAVNDASVRLRSGKVIDWGKLGGFFEDDDVIILKFSDHSPLAPDYVFQFKDIVGIYQKIRADVALNNAYSKDSNNKNPNYGLAGFSPPPQFTINKNESVPSMGIWVFDMDGGQATTMPSGMDAGDDTPPEEQGVTPSVQKQIDDAKKEAEKQRKKAEDLQARLDRLEKREKEREAKEARERAKDRRAGKRRRKRTRKKRK